jgi:Xaa-Pro aminopeptidase
MKESNIDACIIPSFDNHQSEYVADHYKCREWISGFTGSAGTVVITMDSAGLFTDGRYYIQAERELAGSTIKLFKAADPSVPKYYEWLADILPEGSCVGINGSVFSVDAFREIESRLKPGGITVNIEFDPVGRLWEDRPALSDAKFYIHDTAFCGESRVEKLSRVRKYMESRKARYYLLSSLDDIAWLLNIRGSDVPNNPVVISYAVIEPEGCCLFVDKNKVDGNVRKALEGDGVIIKDYSEVQQYLGRIERSSGVLFDATRVNVSLWASINSEAAKIEAPDYTTKLKAIKNETELENFRKCQIRDGIAMVKFVKWVKDAVKSEELTEITAEEKLFELRSRLEHFRGISFNSIIGYQENAAMMHYKAREESAARLKPRGFLLVDSGGQYLDGTTDITRTIVLGELTDEEKRDYTLVLKGNVSLNMLKFLYGATGSNLDVIARRPIWEYSMDYKCGTGHGVGYFLNVHEGPQRLHQIVNNVVFEEGMIITNEPGIYKESKYGIRTENMMVVKTLDKTEFGTFMGFEALTLCPIDYEGIIVDMLSREERNWLNSYHKIVYDKLSPYLDEEEREWLKKRTEEI